MARTRTKVKTRGDQVVFLLKKTEEQEIIDFINEQSTIVDSLRHLIEIAIEINGGIVNLGKNLPSDRDKEWTQNHVTRLAVEYIIRNNIDVSSYSPQGFFPRNYQSEVANVDQQRKLEQTDRERAEEQQRLQEEAEQQKLAEERAQKQREEQEEKRKQEEAQNNSNEQLIALQKQVAELMAAQNANTSQKADITDSISRTSVEKEVNQDNDADNENESKQAAIQAQLADIDPSDF